MFGEKDEAISQFKKKRQEFSESIRKNNRQQKFNKRRNFQSDHLDDTQQESDDKVKYDRQIIDVNLFESLLPICNMDFSENQLGDLIAALSSPDVMQKHYGIIGLRKLLAIQVDPPIQAIIDRGLIPIFMQLAQQNTFVQLKLQAVWCMTNIASGSNEHCKALVDKGALQLFVQCLKNNEKGVVDQALWAIGNLAADRISFRDRIIKIGGLTHLIKIIQTSNNKIIIKNGTWSLTNLCRGVPLPEFNKVKQSVPILCKVLKSGIITDKQVLSDICWALSYMSEGAKSRIQRVLEQGILQLMFKYAQSGYALLCIPALRVIGNFSTGNQLQTQQLLKHGIYNMSLNVLNNVKKSMRRQMCWILSNLVVGPSNHANSFMERDDLIKKLVQIFQTDVLQIRRQICWIFSNLGHSGNLQKVILIFQNYELIKFYVNMLNQDDQDAVQNSLQTLKKILSYGDKCKVNGTNILLKTFENYGGANKLESLQFHESKDIYQLVVDIIQTFFNLQSEDIEM